MHQRGGLKCLAQRFVRHLVRSQPPQFLIDQRQQFVPGLGVALLDGSEDSNDLVHLVSSLAFAPPLLPIGRQRTRAIVARQTRRPTGFTAEGFRCSGSPVVT